jgi:heme A synthase
VGVLAQAALGVATLMAGAPLALSIAHQLLAAGVFTLAIAFAWRVRRP